jgi:hypothetical protein
VLLGNVLVGVVGHQGGRDDTDDRAEQNIERDRITRSGEGEQRRCDQRRGASRDDRGELIADRAAYVPQPRGEVLRSAPPGDRT